MGGSERRSVNFFIRVLVGKFGVEEPVLDAFFLSSVYRLILVGISRGNGIVDGGFWRISLISFFKDLVIL